jgi:hypothetical protein
LKAYVFCFLSIGLIFAIDEVVVSCAFYADVVVAFEHEELSATVLAALASVHLLSATINLLSTFKQNHTPTHSRNRVTNFRGNLSEFNLIDLVKLD